MADQAEMIKIILATVRDDRSLWPKEYTEEESENCLRIIEQLISPQQNSSGVSISEDEYKKTKHWAERVLEIYGQKNPFQGALIGPFAIDLFKTLDRIWSSRTAQNNGSAL